METLSHRRSRLSPFPSLLRFFFFWFVCLLVCFSLYYLNAWDRLHQLLILREVDDSYFRLDFRRLPGPVFDLPRREKAGRVTR